METQWSERLAEMEGWYRNLLRKGSDEAEHALSADYRPHAEYLGELRGRILDVGGGSGLTARYLDSSCEYYVIDPATIWGEPEWREFGSGFRDVGPKVHFLKGTGEELPLKDGSFDAALAFWSLNHASEPRRCVTEMSRVVRPGGKVLLVLEDMVPSWLDLMQFTAQRVLRRLGRFTNPIYWNQENARNVVGTVLLKLPGSSWPLQYDHIRIDESALLATAAPSLYLANRQWRGGFLTLEFVRKQS